MPHSSSVSHRAINAFIFPSYPTPPGQPDLCVILGSGNCAYRVDAALKLQLQPGTRYLVSGGAVMKNGLTEAAFMAARLCAQGIARTQISLEDSSRCTHDNLVHIKPLLQVIRRGHATLRVILITAGFHMRRTLILADSVFATMPWLRIFPVPAYGPHTAPDNWHLNAVGRKIVTEEVAKLEQLNARPAD